MPKKSKSIPVNTMSDESGAGIAIDRLSFTDPKIFEGAERSHRHDCHAFFMVESGSIVIEIDFQKYSITAPSVIYVHPDQVHHGIAAENLTVASWELTNESLRPEYLPILEGLAPAKPLLLNKEMFSIISEAVSLCLKFAERKNDKLYHSLLKDSCNALVALIVSQYLESAKPAGQLSRFEMITKAFRELMERNYTTDKRPATYAQRLNISTSYLNECVKNTTGYSVSHHLQQRVILEAKRLLYYSDKSVKEIAAALGFDDYPYFSRLFTKVTGMTALVFRNKHRD
jgi:AraC family transcriptional activator of pobA